MSRFFLIVTVSFLFMAGCAQTPGGTRGNTARSAGWPEILPMHLLLGDSGYATATDQSGKFIENTAARAASLKNRASALQRPVIDAQQRALLSAALNRHH